MNIPSTAKSGKHYINLTWNQDGKSAARKFYFTVHNKGNWDKDKVAEALTGKHKTVLFLQQGLKGYEGLGDTYIFSPHRVSDRCNARVNFGGSPELFLGTYAQTQRALFRFDLTKVPGKSKVAKAVLRLFLFDIPSGRRKQAPAVIEAYEVLKPWVVGRGVSRYTKPKLLKGEVTWMCHSYPDGKWEKPGCNLPGVDRGKETVGKGTVAGTGINRWVDVELDAKLVQRWIEKPKSNLGIVLKSATEGKAGRAAFRSSEYADGAFRPRLILALD